jgi:transcriptional regulator with XRE-family HTH domain
MPTLLTLGAEIATRRKALGLSQSALAIRASVGRTTLDALENGRIGELGFSKISRILAALGLELKLQEVSGRRPTLKELLDEDRNEPREDDRRGSK